MVRSVGFDLDGTLYKLTDQINERIRSYACQRASEELGRSYDDVRADFDAEFSRTQSGSKSLEAAGARDGKALVQEALEFADVASELRRDVMLAGMLERMSKSRKLYLITSSPEELAIAKMETLGISPEIFRPRLFRESPYLRDDGSAFRFVAESHGVKYGEMVFVGDRDGTDIIPARDLGMWTAIVNATSDVADFHLEEIYDIENIVLGLTSRSS
jgi:FMN phosphatase YigB (HAD superfamily)